MPATGVPRGGWKAYIEACASQVEAKYASRNVRIERVRERRRHKNIIMVADDFKDIVPNPWHSPMLAHVLREAASILGNKLPIPKVFPAKGIWRDSQENSTLREEWLTLAARRMFPDDLYGRITDALVSDGFAVWRVDLRRTSWGTVLRGDDEEAADYIERTEQFRRSHFPFVARFVPGKTFYPVFYDDDGLAEVLEITEREARPVADAYGLGVDVKTQKLVKGGRVTEVQWPGNCKVQEYANRSHFAIKVDGELVKSGEHHYGRQPYYVAPFISQSILDPEDEYLGLADDIVESHDALESEVVKEQIWSEMSSQPLFRVRPVSEEAAPVQTGMQPTNIRWGRGKTVEGVPYGYIWEVVPLPPVNQSTQNMQKFFAGVIDRVSLAPVLEGRLESDISGPTASAQISLAKTLFGRGGENLAAQFSEQGAWMQKMVETEIKAPVPIYKQDGNQWLELAPDDVNSYYEVSYSVHPMIELERMQKQIMAQNLYQNQLVDDIYVLEEGSGIENPEEMQKRVAIFKQRQSAPYQNKLWKASEAIIDDKMILPEPAGQMGGVEPDPMTAALGGGTPAAVPVQPPGPGVPMILQGQPGPAPMPGAPTPIGPPIGTPNGVPLG